MFFLAPLMLCAHLRVRVLVWHLEVGRVFLFDFIPAGFFSRLTVRLLLYCTSQGLWADLLVAARGDAVAVVSMVNSTIEVRVRSDQGLSRVCVVLFSFRSFDSRRITRRGGASSIRCAESRGLV